MVAIKIYADAQMKGAQAQFAALTAQVEALNTAMAQTGNIPMGGTVKGFSALSRAQNASTMAYNHALAASGAYRVESLKVDEAINKTTESLTKQKLGFREVFGKENRKMMKSVYNEQLAMQKATARVTTGMVGDGKTRMSFAVPEQVDKSWDTLGNRVGFFRAQLASASSELVNWGKNTQWAGRQLMAGISFPIAAFGAAAGVMAYQVDKSLSQIVKVYDFSAAATKDAALREKEANDLRARSLENATELARKYGAEITETLGVEQELAATGLSGKALMSSTGEVQRISRLGDIDPTETTAMVVSLQTAFKDTIKDSGDLTKTLNFMNAAGNATSLSLQDIAEATPRAATAIAQLGGTAEQMTILLVSMREAGVNAAEGANALKSATTRIINPVAKATAFYDKYGISLERLANVSGGNLFEYLRLLGQEQQKIVGSSDQQTALLRAQGVAALFGTYQNNRLTASLVNMGDAYAGVENQTSKAMDLMGLSQEELAKRADASMKDVTESVSGKFKIALETMRGELAAIGQPFLEVATYAVTAVSKLVAFFNNMPGWVKKAAIFTAVLAAVVGPVVMLVGLFANFAGTMGRFGAVLLKPLASLQVMSKSQVTAKIAAAITAKAIDKEADSAQMLAQRMEAVARATEYAARAMSKLSGMPLPAGFMNNNNLATTSVPMSNGQMFGPQLPNSAATVKDQRRTIEASNALAKMSDSTGRYFDPDTGKSISRQTAALKANAAITADITDKARAEAAVRQKTQSILSGTNVALGVAGAASAVMMLNINETANNMAKYALVASLVAGPLMSAAKWAKTSAVAAKAELATRLATVRVTAAQSAATGVLALRGAALGAVMSGVKASMLAIMGPLGWTVAAVGALGVAAFSWYKHQEKVKEEQRQLYVEQNKANNALATSSASIATSMGKAAGSYKQLSGPMGATSTAIAGETELNARYDYYKDPEQGGTEVRAFKDIEGQVLEMDTVVAKARQKFVDLQVIGGDTAEQAKTDVQAMLLAVGLSAGEAADIANSALNTIGDAKGANFDWAEQIRSQIDSLKSDFSELGSRLYAPDANYDADGMVISFDIESQLTDEERSAIYQKAKKIAETVSNAMSTAKNPDAAREIWAPYADSAMTEWDRTFEGIQSSDLGGMDHVKELMAQAGITSGQEFAQAIENNPAFKGKLEELMSQPAFKSRNAFLQAGIQSGKDWEGGVVGAFARTNSKIADNVNTVDEASAAMARLGYFGKQAAADAFMPEVGKSMFANTEEAKKLTSEINILNSSLGLKEGRTATEALANLMNNVKSETTLANEEAKKMKWTLENMPGTINIEVKQDQVKGLLQDGMKGVQSDMSDMITDNFDRQMDSAIAGNESYWDGAIQRLQESQEKASDALDANQEREQERFDARWERRKNIVTEAYDKRIDATNKAIEAEEKAEEIRQKIFEAEKTRLERLTESANRTIDFNMALQTGDLDEAAKIRNDMDAAAQNWALSDGAEKSSSASDRRKERLGDRADRLGNKKDAALKALEKREDSERKSLERRQDNEKKHLQKVQKMNADALNKQAENAKKAFQKSWEYRRDGLDREMDTFRSFVPKNMKQLEKWMKQMGISYEKFGIDTLNPKSKKWGGWFKSSLKDNIRDAGLEIGSSNMWENMGAKTAKKTLRGMGFGGINDFEKFIRTGKLPGNFGNLKPEVDNSPAGRQARDLNVANGGNKLAGMQGLHTGGIVGSSTSSRTGYARTAPVSRNERVILAEKGEGIVNKDATAKYGSHIEAMNKGIFDPSVNSRGGIMGGATGGNLGGMAGLVAAAMSRGFQHAAANAIQVATEPKLAAAKMAAFLGFSGGNYTTFGSIAAGQYGGTSYTSEQLANASTIASVGKSLGASGRDIVIALMTAMQESTLRNLDYGDRDSVGLFQQRDAWGSFADRTNPEKSARMFFLGGAAGQRGLFDFPDRGSMSLAQAAQSVQVSAFPDAYAKWQDEASAIYAALGRAGTSTSAGAGYVPGSGKRSSPMPGRSHGGIHDSYTGYPAVDFAAPVGSPIYAVANGVISDYKEYPGTEPRNTVQNGYRSYGKVLYLKTDAGPTVLMAHIYDKYVNPGQRVQGGAKIAASGNYGHSTGPHLHFGATNGPLAWLKTGGQTLNDGMAMLHRGETVLTKPLTDDLNRTVQAFGQAAKNQMSGKTNRVNNTEINNNGVMGGYSPRTKAPGQMRRVVDFAKAQVGKPYVWGAVGPNGYDCSGLQSALINFIKGKNPYSRLFATSNMSSVLPGLGFKPGRGGPNDYTVGWDAGSHTSGRLGNYGIESTGNAVRGDGAARAPETFRAVAHLPLSRNPKGGVGAGRPNSKETGNGKSRVKKPKKVVVPWTKEDDVNSSPESWGPETLKADPTQDTGFWTYTSAMAQATGQAMAAAKEKLTQDVGAVSGAANIRTGTFNVKFSSSNKATQGALSKLMPQSDILSLTEMANGKRGLAPWIQSKGWGYFSPNTKVHNETGIAWNKQQLQMMQGGSVPINPKNGGHNGWNTHRAATYGLFRDIDTNNQFWQIAAHTVGLAQRGNPGAAAIMNEQYGNLAKLVTKLEKTGKPVVMAGDLNTNTDRFKFKFPFGDLINNKTSRLDRILNSKGTKISGVRQVNAGGGSDHNAILSNFSIPSHKSGAENIKWDNTLVNVHKKESILTAEQSDKFRNLANNIDNVAGGSGNQYNYKVYVTEPVDNVDQLADAIIKKTQRHEARKPQSRSGN